MIASMVFKLKRIKELTHLHSSLMTINLLESVNNNDFKLFPVQLRQILISGKAQGKSQPFHQMVHSFPIWGFKYT